MNLPSADGPPMSPDFEEPVALRAHAAEERSRYADNRKHPEFGLCSKCRHMAIRIHMSGAYLDKIAYCEMFAGLDGRGVLRLHAERPVKDCCRFWPIGAPTLREMLAEAKFLATRPPDGYL